jgi:hypothetical protein
MWYSVPLITGGEQPYSDWEIRRRSGHLQIGLARSGLFVTCAPSGLRLFVEGAWTRRLVTITGRSVSGSATVLEPPYDPLFVGEPTGGSVQYSIRFASTTAATLTITVNGLGEPTVSAPDGSFVSNQTCATAATVFQMRAERVIPHKAPLPRG